MRSNEAMYPRAGARIYRCAWARRSAMVLVSMALLAGGQSAAAQAGGAPRHTLIGPGLHLFSVARGNLVVRIGAKESFVAGAQRPELVAAARALLASEHAPPVRFALAMASEDATREGDGGWSASGAVSLAHELARARMMRAGVPALPSMGFSEVVQLGLSGDEAHVVHQPAGYSDADVIVHLEAEGVLMLGADYASDGYPDLDLSAGGSFDGLVKTIDTFTRNFGQTRAQFVPLRGAATNGVALREYRDMLVAVRDRVAKLVAGGATERDVVAAKPTAPFDARWGRGPVSGDHFAALAFRSLARR
jgi:cyclase